MHPLAKTDLPSSLPRALHHRDNENVRAPRFLLRRPRRRVQGDQGPSACEFFVEIFFSLHPSCFLASSSSSSLVLVRLLPSATATSRMKWIRRRRFGRVASLARARVGESVGDDAVETMRRSFRSRRASSGRSPNRIQIQSIRASFRSVRTVGPRGCRWIWLCMHKQLFTTCVVYEHSRVGLKISTSARASDSFLSLDVIFIR